MRGDLRATFSGWKIPDGRVLKGQYEVMLHGIPGGKYAYRYKAILVQTGVEFYDSRGKPLTFAESKLEEGKAQIGNMFETQLTEWTPSR